MPHPAQILLTPMTDERNFPRHDPNAPPGHSGHPWPKMLTRHFTEEDQEAWLKKNKKIDIATRQEYYDEKVPSVGAIVPLIATAKLVALGLAKTAGDIVVVQDKDEEERVLDALGMRLPPAPPETVSIPIAGGAPEDDTASEITKLRAELAAMKAKKPAPKRRKRPARAGHSTPTSSVN